MSETTYKLKASSQPIHAFRIGIDPYPDWFQKEVDAGNIILRANAGEGRMAAEIKAYYGTENAMHGDFVVRAGEKITAFAPEEFGKLYEQS
jgi:hypothetical protein